MSHDHSNQPPTSPEASTAEVREELDQDMVTHQGDYRKGIVNPGVKHGGSHLGAMEDENVPIVPPMSGPADLLGDSDVNAQGNESGNTQTGDETFDPREELTPG